MKRVLIVLRHTQKELDKDLKYIGIIKSLEYMGFEVWYSYFEKNRIVIRSGKQIQTIKKINVSNEKIFKLLRNSLLFSAITKLFKSGFQAHYVYIRQMPCIPSYLSMLKQIKRRDAKIIVEIPTYPSTGELQTDKRTLVKIVKPILDKVETKSAVKTDLYALIGEHSDIYLGRPAINISNGIDIEKVPIRNPKINTEEIHILCLAKMARWHGYERLIQGLSQYYEKENNKKNIYIHLVGPEGDGSLNEWKKLAKELDLEKYILFEGSRIGAELDEIVDRCDVAAATLGAFKINIKNFSTLKVREYVARGIPFIYAFNDNAIDETLPFWRKFENVGKPIDIEIIIQFVGQTRKIEKLPQKMHQYAKENMTWENQFRKIFSALENR